MIPITKNIIVTDEFDNEYQSTYLRRAKGLVKNGRARWIDENKIYLVCPPNKILEDKIMEDNIKEQTVVQIPKEKPLELTMEYVLSRIDRIMKDIAYIHEAVNAIKDMPVNESPNGGTGDMAKGEAIGKVVESRESTNQQLIHLLEKMYDNLKPQTPSVKEKAMNIVERTLNNPTLSLEERQLTLDMFDSIRHIDN
jgi:hypothetical protein